MKIAVLGTRGFPGVQGGIETHCQYLYPRLAKMGCDVTVFTRSPYVNTAIKNYRGVTLSPLICPKSKFFETIIHTFKGVFAARRIKPDILHIHAVGPSIIIPLARLLGMRTIMTTQGPDYKREKWGFFARFVLRLGERIGCHFSDEVICVSKYMADDIKKKYGKTCHTIPNGVDIPDILQSEEALKRFSLVKDKYILMVGRLVPEKGASYLIDSFNEAHLEGWKLVIVGEADHESKYSLKLKEKARKNSNIVLTGFLTGRPLEELFSHAGLFVLPSYHEGLPLVLLEGLSYGLQCVVSDIQANRTVTLAEENYFQAGDSKQLCEKLKLFSKKTLTPKEKLAQIEVIRQDYDWGKIASEVFKVYTRALHEVIPILNSKYDNITFNFAIKEALSLMAKKEKANVFFLNADCLYKAQKDDEYRENLNSANLILPDGIGLRVATSLLGGRMKENCNGSDFLPSFMTEAGKKRFKMFFLGAKKEVAAKAAENVRSKLPEIQVTGTHPGYFSDDEEVINIINKSGADILFVGMGVPLQEKWICRNRNRLNPKLCFAVGALFDYLSGHIKRAPKIVRFFYMEWVWRLIMEPRRLWKRYLVDDMKFFLLVFKHKLRQKR